MSESSESSYSSFSHSSRSSESSESVQRYPSSRPIPLFNSNNKLPNSNNKLPNSNNKLPNSTNNLNNVKTQLKEIEDFVINKIENAKDKTTFLYSFRNFIIDYESEVINFPTPSFFISKFESTEQNNIPSDLKEKILELLHEKQYQDKQKKSKLKYW